MVGSSNFTLLIVIQFHGASGSLCLLVSLSSSLSPSLFLVDVALDDAILVQLVDRYSLSIPIPYNFRQTVLETPYRPKIQRGGLDNCLTSSLTILISRQTLLDPCILVKLFGGSRIRKSAFRKCSSRYGKLTFQYLILFEERRRKKLFFPAVALRG